MDLDHEHSVPYPIPDADYLAGVRRSIQENVKTRFQRFSLKSIQSIKEFEASHKKGFGLDNPHKYIEDPNAPPDKGKFVLITVFLFGLVQILPFAFFMTANEYWMYKFRNVSSESTDANDRTDMQKYFSSFTMLTITTPGLVCTFLAAVAGHKIKAELRIFSVLIVHSSILIFQSIFANINTDEWQRIFFGISLGSSFVMSCAMSLGGSGAMGLISKLPHKYMKAKLTGEGVSQVFSAVLRLLTIYIAPSATSSALLYFITGSCLMVGMTIVLFCATKTEFFRYFTRNAKAETKQQIRNYNDIKDVTLKIWPLLFLPLFDMIIPVGSITALVVSEYYGTDSVWGQTYFITVCTFLIPAICGLLGRAIFNGFDIELPLPLIYLVSISRAAILGSLLFFTNAKPRHHLPVLLSHDWEYSLLTGLKALSDGFMMNLTSIKTMRSVPPDRIELAMMISMFCFGGYAALTSPLGVVAVSLL
ncbi:unnamed protein product [Ceutorhynchus assimilis]|uniref:Uncharacterized protein n=1 Tax=Ceutorhynchus assimilis TaxID=467358 RepID=A0A9P0DLG1_9CUCU|nr:unnamed protein product [Ceutorhynchus assimilis]